MEALCFTFPSHRLLACFPFFLGFYSASSGIVYIQNPKSVILPWEFNFRVKSNEVKVVEGKVTYPSKVIQPLSTTGASVCWLESCSSQTGHVNNLDLHLSNPEIGDYEMEIVLEMDDRRKKLLRKVCVASLTGVYLVKRLTCFHMTPYCISVVG